MGYQFNMNRKIYVVDGGMGMSSGNWMGDRFVRNMEDADLVVFTGGQDINPMLYGEPRHPLTHYSPRRDEYEVTEFKNARSMDKNMLGICRGAQLLCAMAGGKLVQHQENRGGHEIETNGGGKIVVTSCHHQAQFPWGLPKDSWRLLGWSFLQSAYHEDGNQKEMLGGDEPYSMTEVEDVYYPKLKALAVQGHPEWIRHTSPTITHYRKLLDALEAGDL